MKNIEAKLQKPAPFSPSGTTYVREQKTRNESCWHKRFCFLMMYEISNIEQGIINVEGNKQQNLIIGNFLFNIRYYSFPKIEGQSKPCPYGFRFVIKGGRGGPWSALFGAKGLKDSVPRPREFCKNPGTE